MTISNSPQRPSPRLYTPKEGVQVSRQTAMASLPMVRVAQDQSGNRTPGLFYMVSTGEEWASLEGTPLAIREGHIKWPTPFQGAGQSPECWSNDTIMGAPGAKYAGRDCSSCEHFLNGCTPNFSVVFLRLPEHQQVLLTLTRGMSRVIGELLQNDTVRARHVTLFTKKIRGRLGSWYTVELDRDMPLLDPQSKINIERFFRERYVPQDVSLPYALEDGATGEVAEVAKEIVDMQTGEISNGAPAVDKEEEEEVDRNFPF